MKKIISLTLAVIMVLALSITAFAADGAFIQSPGKVNPEISNFQTSIPNYDGRIIIVPYHKKDTLPAEESQLMDKAYNEISGKTTTSNLKEVIGFISKNSNTTSDKLGVVDLFDIHEEGATVVTADGQYTFTISLEGVNNYKSLIYMDSEGVWRVVQGAKISADGKSLTFTTTTLSSPFALVVEKTDAATSVGGSPKTGDNTAYYIYAVVACFSAIAALIVSKKRIFGIKQ